MTVSLSFDEEICFDSPRKFLSNFRKSDHKWCPDAAWTSTWVFRGVTDSTYSLKPSAWRYWDSYRKSVSGGTVCNDAYYDLYCYLIKSKYSAIEKDISEFVGKSLDMSYCKDRELFERLVYSQYYFEYWLIEKFAAHLNELGHSIPSVPPSEADYRFEKNESKQFYIPTLFGIAQHHGIPTRFLDWTYNPLKAIYFAAQKGAKYKVDSDLAVWAMNLGEDIEYENVEARIVPRGHVTFLKAQEGLFTTFTNPLSFVRDNLEWPCIENLIPSKLRKYTISSEHSLELLRLLNLEGISQHSLMPTLDNAAKSMIHVMPDLVSSLRKLE